MSTENLIEVKQICTGYGIEFSFISSLNEHGLIEIITIENNNFIDRDHLSELEKMMRLHFELGLNLEGIEVALNLLQKIDEMEQELKSLREKTEL